MVFVLPVGCGVAVRSPAATWQVCPGALVLCPNGGWVGPEGEESECGNFLSDVGYSGGSFVLGFCLAAIIIIFGVLKHSTHFLTDFRISAAVRSFGLLGTSMA